MKPRASLTAIRELSDSDVGDRAKRLEEQLFQLKLKQYTNQLENTNLIREARREIARCKTILVARKAGLDSQKQQSMEAKEVDG